jgi:hypothetical protein
LVVREKSESEAGERVFCIVNNKNDTSAQSGSVASRSLSFTSSTQVNENEDIKRHSSELYSTSPPYSLKLLHKRQTTMSNPNQHKAPGAPYVCESTIPAHNFGVFGGGLMPADHRTIPLSPSAGFIKRTVRYLMHPPAQPDNPPVNFITVNLDWARAIVGNQHFKPMPMEEDPARFYERGLIGKRKKVSRPGLKERGLEFGLPYLYYMALCGERKPGCDGEELILTKEEWEDGKEKREELEIEWMKLP